MMVLAEILGLSWPSVIGRFRRRQKKNRKRPMTNEKLREGQVVQRSVNLVLNVS